MLYARAQAKFVVLLGKNYLRAFHETVTLRQEVDDMRTDYGLYVVAVICFIIAALPYTNEFLKLDNFMSLTFTVIFAALGLILIILGYSLRPKPIISIPEAPKPALPLSPPPEEPAPLTPPQKETVKPERKKTKAKTRRKGTRRRRKKA